MLYKDIKELVEKCKENFSCIRGGLSWIKKDLIELEKDIDEIWKLVNESKESD